MDRLPIELIHHIVDLLVEAFGTKSLCQLSLVNKAISAYTRHCMFLDLSINICPEIHIPWCINRACYVGACNIPCIKQLAPLLRAPASIPRSIRTLTLKGDKIYDDTFPPQAKAKHSGGMDDERVTGPVMAYFEAVEELRLLQVPLYPLSYWALFRWRPLTFLSSVRTVVLDKTKFYGGPPLLHAFISRMPNLQSLYMKGVTWPADCQWSGYPVDVPGWSAILAQDSSWSHRVRETLFPKQWKPLLSSPSHLILHLEDSADALSWVMMPMLSEMLSKLSSLEIHASRENDVTEFLLQRLLESVPNIVHLSFCWHSIQKSANGCALKFHPDLSRCTSLRTVHLRLMCRHRGRSWPFCKAWLRSTARSIRDLPNLRHVQVTMDLNIDDMSLDDASAFDADEDLYREGRTVEARIGIQRDYWIEYELIESVGRWYLRSAFSRSQGQEWSWPSCKAWLRFTARSMRDLLSLKNVQITMDLNIDDTVSLDEASAFDADEDLYREGRTVEARIGIQRDYWIENELIELGRWYVRSAFPSSQGQEWFVSSVKAGWWPHSTLIDRCQVLF